MTVTAIVVNYHTASFLPGLLADLGPQAAVGRVIVVDNSGELQADAVAGYAGGGRVELLQPGENIGFGAAVNLAAARADGDYLLLVNPDIRLFPGCLDHLVRALRDHNAVLAGPRFYWDEKKMFRLPPATGASAWFDAALAGAGASRLEAEHLAFYWQLRHERFWTATAPFPEPFLSGACLLLDRRQAGREDGTVFDPRFFLYYEDTDLSARALLAGRTQICVPAAAVLHYYDQAPAPAGGKAELMVAAHRAFREKYYPALGCEMPVSTAGAAAQEESEDLGTCAAPPYFRLPSAAGPPKDGCRYMEIGVNPFFIPFAQAVLPADRDNGMGVPADIWQRLAPGVYYTRIRDCIRGTLKRWKWRRA